MLNHKHHKKAETSHDSEVTSLGNPEYEFRKLTTFQLNLWYFQFVFASSKNTLRSHADTHANQAFKQCYFVLIRPPVVKIFEFGESVFVCWR